MASPTHTVQGVASGISSIDDKQLNIDNEIILAPLRRAVKEQVDYYKQAVAYVHVLVGTCPIPYNGTHNIVGKSMIWCTEFVTPK